MSNVLRSNKSDMLRELGLIMAESSFVPYVLHPKGMRNLAQVTTDPVSENLKNFLEAGLLTED